MLPYIKGKTEVRLVFGAICTRVNTVVKKGLEARLDLGGARGGEVGKEGSRAESLFPSLSWINFGPAQTVAIVLVVWTMTDGLRI